MATEVATPRRRSARLKASNNTPGPSGNMTLVKHALASVIERDETPNRQGDSLDAAVDIDLPSHTSMPGAFEHEHSLETLKTPESVKQPRPSHEDMHPEHAHQNTVKVSNAGLELGFTDVNPYQSSPLRSYQHGGDLSPAPVPHAKSSPTHSFKFNHDRHDLNEEAQRIMESVREEASRIKEEMRQQRAAEQARQDADADALRGRKIAKPRRRFSDVHKAEFDKMPSIADHLSTLKAKSTAHRSSPGKPEASPLPKSSSAKAAIHTPVKNLKRSHSKADMDAQETPKTGDRLKRTLSKASLLTLTPTKAATNQSQLTQNSAPPKRRKVVESQDVSDARGKQTDLRASSVSPKKPGIPTAALSPTKSSLLRLHNSRKTQSPAKAGSTLSRSRSLKDLAGASSIRSASDKIASAVVNKVNTVRSILHKPQPKYSDDPLKIAAGTHVPPPRATPSADEGTPSLPGSPHPKHILPRTTPKKVEFAPDTKGAAEDKVTSPSPSKLPSIRVLPAKRDADSDPSPSKFSPSKEPSVVYPTLPMESLQAKTSSPAASRPNPLRSHPPAGGDFTFTHDKRIVFAGSAEPASSSPKRVVAPAVSPARNKSSIRQVQPSGTYNAPLGVSPSGANASSPRNGPPAMRNHLLAVPHGMTNKKRAREVDDSSSDLENRDPSGNSGSTVDIDNSSPRKRAKMAAGVSANSSCYSSSAITTPRSGQTPTSSHGLPSFRRSNSASPTKAAVRPGAPKSSPLKTPRRQTGFGGAGAAGSGLAAPATTPRKGLSVSRLNFLSRPRERR